MVNIISKQKCIVIDGASLPLNSMTCNEIANGAMLTIIGGSGTIMLKVDNTTIDGGPVADRAELITFLQDNCFSINGGGSGGDGAVNSVTGNLVTGTESDPIIDFPIGDNRQVPLYKDGKVIADRLGWSQFSDLPTPPTFSNGFLTGTAFQENGKALWGIIEWAIGEDSQSIVKPNAVPGYNPGIIGNGGGTIPVADAINDIDAVNLGQLRTRVLNEINSNPILLNKVDKVNGLGLSQTSFTQAEKTKLSTIVEHYAGRFVSLDDLNAIVGSPGGYAYVSINNAPTVLYAWNGNTLTWDSTVFAVSEETPESIKTKYESNADTNVYSDAEKAKLTGIANQATKNDTDANLRNRANHTGTQSISTITDLTTTIDTINQTNASQNTAIGGKQAILQSGVNIKTIGGQSILGSGNIPIAVDNNTIISTVTANGVKTNQYADRFEYTCKVPFSIGVLASNFNTINSTYILPAGVTIDGSDEHYISIRTNTRTCAVTVWDNPSTRAITIGFANTWNGNTTPTGSVFVKLIKYK